MQVQTVHTIVVGWWGHLQKMPSKLEGSKIPTGPKGSPYDIPALLRKFADPSLGWVLMAIVIPCQDPNKDMLRALDEVTHQSANRVGNDTPSADRLSTALERLRHWAANGPPPQRVWLQNPESPDTILYIIYYTINY